jgi:methyl-accepting chemotaxis protein
MNAISPFSLAEIRKPAQALGNALREAGSLAAKTVGPDGGFRPGGKRSAVDFAQATARIATRAFGNEGRISTAKAFVDHARSIRPNSSSMALGSPELHDTIDTVRSTIGTVRSTIDTVRSTAETVRDTAETVRSTIGTVRDTAETVHDTLTDAAGSVSDRTRTLAAFAAERAMQAHLRLSNAPPALPGAPAAQADENRPMPDLVRAAYATLIRLN